MCSFSSYLHSAELLVESRLSPKAFTRNRKLTFAKLLSLMLSGMTSSVQQELDRLAGMLLGSTDLIRDTSAQAFSKARQGFSAKAFRLLNQKLIGLTEENIQSPRWRGLRIVAADASKLLLSLKDATARKAHEAIAFMLYLPGLEMTLDFELYSPKVGERQMLFEHLKSLRKDDLLVLDRGYPASWLIAVLILLGIPFCIRADDTGFAAVRKFRRSGLREAIVMLPAPKKADVEDYNCSQVPSKVRLVRVVTPNGKEHILITSLLDTSAYPAAEFAALYHARWRIEEAFKRIKHRLCLEQLTGLNWLAAQQDFGAKLLCDNLNALAAYVAAPEPFIRDGGRIGADADEISDVDPAQNGDAPADVAGQESNKPSLYKLNRTYGIALLRRCLARWLLLELPSPDELSRLFNQWLKNPIRYIEGASKPRNKGPKPHKYFAYKPAA